jgi:hypothetical protein
MSARLDLSSVVDYLHHEDILGGAPRPRVEAIPGHRQGAWDCVIAERRFDGDPRVDVMGALCERADGGLPPSLHDGELLAGHPIFERWRRGGADPIASAPLLWFEWDLPDGQPRTPLASICVSNTILGEHAARRAPAASAASPLLDAAAGALLVGGGDARWGAALRRVTAALEPRGELLHIAGLAPRGLTRLRLALHLQAAMIPDWLRAIAWPGDTAELGPLLFRIAAPFTRIGVQIEITPEIGPYLAFEAPELRTEAAAERARGAIHHLAEIAPINPDTADDFTRWPGLAVLRRGDLEIPLLRHCYIKLVRSGPRAWSAKGYFGVTTRSMTEAAPRKA